MSNYSLSLCMIVKNEEEFLQRCLESVKNLVNEIIIIDTGSTDSTIDIANAYNAKVYNYIWNGDFSAVRNYSIKKATSDYVLILDADEYLDENSHLLLENLNIGKDYYIVNIKNYLDNQIFLHQAIRVFKKNTRLIYKGKIHEHLNIEDYDGLTREIADFWIHHTGYQSNLYTKRNKHDRNLTLLLEEVQNNPSGYNYFNLGNQYKANGDFEKAIDAYKQGFYLSKDRIYLSYLLDQMGKCLLYLGRFEEGIELVSNSIDNFPTYTNLYYTLGELYESIGYLNDAELCYLKCIQLGDVKDQQTVAGVGGYLAHFNLSRVYDRRGDLPKALEQCFLSLSQNRNYKQSLMYLLRLLVKGNIPLDEMRKFLDNCYPIREQRDLNNLLISLFITRSPLLLQYLDSYQLQVESIIKTIAFQYGNRVYDAYNEWANVENITYELAEDVFALSLKIISLDLLSLIKNHFNDNDYDILKDFILKKENIKLNQKLRDFLVKVIPKVGLLRDQETVKYLLNLITANNRKENVGVLRELIEVGLNNLVIEYTSTYLKDNLSENHLEILGDLYFRNGLFSNALQMFNQLKELNPQYLSCEKLYNVYQKIGNVNSMRLLEKEIKATFPLVKWIK